MLGPEQMVKFGLSTWVPGAIPAHRPIGAGT